MTLKETILRRINSGLSSEKLSASLRRFQIFTDEDNTFDKSFAKYKTELITPISSEQLEDLFDQTLLILNQNPLAKEAIAKINTDEELLSETKSYFEKLPQNKLEELFTYCIVLERLTKIFTTDLEALRDYANKNSFSLDHLIRKGRFNPVAWIKLRSVELALRKSLLEHVRFKPLRSLELKALLFLNIFEIAIFDAFGSGIKNLRRGLDLAFNWPSVIEQDPQEDLVIKHKNDLEWVDKYQYWNFIFTLGLKDFPLSSIKLLIPSVIRYQNNPEKYMDNRIISLFLYVVYMHIQFQEARRTGIPYDYKFPFKKELRKLLN